MDVAGELQSNILQTRIGTMTYLAPVGSLATLKDVEDFNNAVQDCIDRNENQLVLDLASVKAVSSMMLNAMAGAQTRLVRTGGWIKVINLGPVVRDVFRLTRFTEYVGVLDADADDFAARRHPGAKLGDILIARGTVPEARIHEAVELQAKTSRRMGQILVEKGWATEQEVLTALGEQLGVPFVRIRPGLYDPEVARMLPKEVANRLKVVPMHRVRDVLSLATSDPQAIPAFDEVEERLKCRVQPVLVVREEIVKAIGESYAGDLGADTLIEDLDEDFEVVSNLQPEDYTAIDELAEGSPVINLVNSLVQRAVRERASDIHIEPGRKKSRVRFRIDGLLYEITTLRPELHPAVVSRLKVMANLDIAERRLPQDGRIQVHTQGRAVDLRFSSLPGLFGEKIVLRVLDKNQSLLDINKIGMSPANLRTYKMLLEHSYGLILVTGPTGSGKTTSLYAALNYLNSIEKNIVTIEDPVEYQLDIVNQNEVREGIGLGFSTILKHALRQDPDIVMVGEIRERETAEIAVQAALTGHLVLSTLHTNHAIGAITRMIDMGVEPYLLSSALIGVVAQRLVRTICPACKTKYTAPVELAERFGWDRHAQVARGRGCPECYDSGYKGRIGIHEVLQIDGELQQLVTANPSRDVLNAYLQNKNIKTLFHDGIAHVRAGETTIEEVSRVINA